MTLNNLCCVLLVALTGVPVLEAKVQISWTGEVTTGFSTIFTCSSSSCFSNCIYTWFIKGRAVNGNTLTWTPDGRENTVELRCTVLNPETGVSSSTVSTVEIKNQVSVQNNPRNSVPGSQSFVADQWNVTIDGPDIVFVGYSSQFTCLANCTVNAQCSIYWQFKGGIPPGSSFQMSGNMIKWVPNTPNTSHNFTCIAENAEHSAQATKIIQVKDTPAPPSGSAGLQTHGLFAVILSLGLLVLFES